MANFDGVIDPAEDWPDVPSLSATCPALGGGSGAGPMNAQAMAIVARLKQLNTSKSPVGHNHDGEYVPVVEAQFVNFDTTPTTIPTAPGSLYWDSADSAQTLALIMAGGNVIQQIGEEQYIRVKASAAITNGQSVMFTGTVGASGAVLAAPASGLTAGTAFLIIGIATEDIALNGWGYVTTFGVVRGIDTSAFSDGQILYYDPAVTGGLTATVPSAPNAKIQLCAVIHAATNGSLLVRPAFGGTLGQFEGDVDVSSKSAGDGLVWNGTKWIAQSNLVIDSSYVHTDNNYTAAEKAKLAGIEAGAEVNVNADWNSTGGDSQILNKPTLFSGSYNDLTDKPIPVRYLNIIAVEKSATLVNGTDIIGAFECPVAGTITAIRAKTTTGTATVTVNNGGAVVGSISATSAGVTVNSGLTNTTVAALADMTIDVSSAAGTGLTVIITVQESEL